MPVYTLLSSKTALFCRNHSFAKKVRFQQHTIILGLLVFSDKVRGKETNYSGVTDYVASCASIHKSANETKFSCRLLSECSRRLGRAHHSTRILLRLDYLSGRR